MSSRRVWVKVCTPVWFWWLSGCYRAGDPPAWWWNDPIDASLYCSSRKVSESASGQAGKAGRVPEDIQRDVRATYKEMQNCYENLLALMPEARGLVQTRFVIAEDGSVPYACINEATLNDNTMAECVLQTFRRIEFGPSSEVVTVVYPLRFAPGP